MLAAGADQAVRDQDERAIRQRDPGLAGRLEAIEDGVEIELTPERPQGQHRPPVPGGGRLDVIRADVSWLGRLAGEQLNEAIDMGREEVFTAEVEDGAMLALAVLAVRLDQAEVLVKGVAFGSDPHSAQEHRP